MEELRIKEINNGKIYKEVSFLEYKIFTGYRDKNNNTIYTGDEIEYTDRDGSKHRAEIKFSIESGTWLYWKTWHPFRKDLKYWLGEQKDNVELITNNK